MTTNPTVIEANRRLLADMYAAGARGDFAFVASCMDPDIEVIEPPFLPYAGTYRGLAQFQELMGKIAHFADLSTIGVDYLVADGERVIGFLHMRDQKTGKNLQLAEQSTIRNGKVVEMKIFYFDAGSMVPSGTTA